MTDEDLAAHVSDSLGVAGSELAGLTPWEMIALAGDTRLAEGLDLDLDELAVRCGTTPETARDLYVRLGLEPAQLAGFGDGDVGLLEFVVSDEAELINAVSDELLRVAGRSLRQVADAIVAAYVQDVENDPNQRTDDVIALADANAFASELLVRFANTLPTVFRHHMWVAVRNQRSGQSGLDQPQLIRAGIGFVDLVGFTTMSLDLEPRELMALIGDFEFRAFEVAARHGGRVVKSIGDEVMITGPDHDTVATIALALVRDVREITGTGPRVGLSSGEVIFRLGDYYGPVVNTAARLADVAGPGEVLTNIGTSDTRLTAEPAGHRMLRGFTSETEVWSLS